MRTTPNGWYRSRSGPERRSRPLRQDRDRAKAKEECAAAKGLSQSAERPKPRRKLHGIWTAPRAPATGRPEAIFVAREFVRPSQAGKARVRPPEERCSGARPAESSCRK